MLLILSPTYGMNLTCKLEFMQTKNQ
uniref:Uncharacterized protein n=1 Tax=Rhizophora mucronata TaxID=61149 RepID=A0A2P2QTW9_RHIMU